MGDTLLFGAKVLSSPRNLTRVNQSDIENNVVDGKTSWRHQNAYALAMMAGCINQAKKILSKYDEVLFGPAPEVLIEPTHQAIRDMLKSPEVKAFVARLAEGKEATSADDDTFIRVLLG